MREIQRRINPVARLALTLTVGWVLTRFSIVGHSGAFLADPNLLETLRALLGTEPNEAIPVDPEWRDVRAVALQDFCNQWLRGVRRECIEYVWRPTFRLVDDPNNWRNIQPGVYRIQRWTYDPNGIHITDCLVHYNLYDFNKDGIVNLKDYHDGKIGIRNSKEN